MTHRICTASDHRRLALKDPAGAAAAAGEDLGHLPTGGREIDRRALPGAQDESPLLPLPRGEKRDPVGRQPGQFPRHALEERQVARRPVAAGDLLAAGHHGPRGLDRQLLLQRPDRPLRLLELVELRLDPDRQLIIRGPDDLPEARRPLVMGGQAAAQSPARRRRRVPSPGSSAGPDALRQWACRPLAGRGPWRR